MWVFLGFYFCFHSEWRLTSPDTSGKDWLYMSSDWLTTAWDFWQGLDLWRRSCRPSLLQEGTLDLFSIKTKQFGWLCFIVMYTHFPFLSIILGLNVQKSILIICTDSEKWQVWAVDLNKCRDITKWSRRNCLCNGDEMELSVQLRTVLLTLWAVKTGNTMKCSHTTSYVNL